MAIKSKFPGACKSCGKPHLKDDMIDMNADEHWCIDGKNCQGAQQLQGTTKSTSKVPETKAPQNDEDKFTSARKNCLEFIDFCQTHDLTVKDIIPTLAAVWNTGYINGSKR